MVVKKTFEFVGMVDMNVINVTTWSGNGIDKIPPPKEIRT